jgi:hypothetical protein
MNDVQAMADDLAALIEKHKIPSVLVVIPDAQQYFMMAFEMTNKDLRNVGHSILAITPNQNTVLN